MGTGAKIALGCGCVLVLAGALAVGACGLLGYWAKGKFEGVAADVEGIAKRVEARTEEIDSWEQKANANVYSPPADGVISEARLLTFLDVRKRVYETYRSHEAFVKEVEKRPGQPAPGDLLSAGSRLAEAFADLRLARAKALAELGMSEGEYRDIQMAVYKTAWASGAAGTSGKMPSEAVAESMAQAGKALEETARSGVAAAQREGVPGASHLSPEDARKLQEGMAQLGQATSHAIAVPQANVELFRRHEAEIRRYAMDGLAVLGL
jgi:hypothetical protein